MTTSRSVTIRTGCFASALFFAIIASAQYRVSTVAGNPCATGSIDGIGSSALLDAPAGIAWDDIRATGVLADITQHVIRRFTPDGRLTTVAGIPGQRGYRDGPAPDALFSFPSDVAIDTAGSIYVADSQNGAIRKIDNSNLVSTVAKSFVAPVALAASPSGEIYVVDNNREILVVSAAGAVRSLAGNQTASAIIQDGWQDQARFRSVQSIAVAPNGTLFVTDTCTVRTVTSDGYVSTLAGLPISECFDPVPASTPQGARFNNPTGIAVDQSGNIYIADEGNGVIQRIASNGHVAVIAGTLHSTISPEDGVPGIFGYLRDLAVSRDGKLWITDMHRDSPPPCRNGATVRSADPPTRRRAIRH